MQRVDAIDRMYSCKEYQKTYIIPRFKSFRTVRIQVAPNCQEIQLSIWCSFYLLIKLIKQADVVYVHSLYGISLAGFLFLRFLKDKNLVWDVHGIIPEEIHLAGYSKLKQYVYGKLEVALARRAKKIVVVTNAMAKYLHKKYLWLNARILIYPILPMTIKKELKFDTSEQQTINFVYAGNMQGYQNIPLMVESIKKIIDTPRLHFYILTGQKEQMKDLFQQLGIGGRDNITIDSVAPSELDRYYCKAHYGYVLRDDVDVNNVACPTKIVEYLAYGMTCITKSNDIGDFGQMGFDYINVDELDATMLKGVKSKKNLEIYEQILGGNKTELFKSFILES